MSQMCDSQGCHQSTVLELNQLPDFAISSRSSGPGLTVRGIRSSCSSTQWRMNPSKRSTTVQRNQPGGFVGGGRGRGIRFNFSPDGQSPLQESRIHRRDSSRDRNQNTGASAARGESDGGTKGSFRSRGPDRSDEKPCPQKRAQQSPIRPVRQGTRFGLLAKDALGARTEPRERNARNAVRPQQTEIQDRSSRKANLNRIKRSQSSVKRLGDVRKSTPRRDDDFERSPNGGARETELRQRSMERDQDTRNSQDRHAQNPAEEGPDQHRMGLGGDSTQSNSQSDDAFETYSETRDEEREQKGRRFESPATKRHVIGPAGSSPPQRSRGPRYDGEPPTLGKKSRQVRTSLSPPSRGPARGLNEESTEEEPTLKATTLWLVTPMNSRWDCPGALEQASQDFARFRL